MHVNRNQIVVIKDANAAQNPATRGIQPQSTEQEAENAKDKNAIQEEPRTITVNTTATVTPDISETCEEHLLAKAWAIGLPLPTIASHFLQVPSSGYHHRSLLYNCHLGFPVGNALSCTNVIGLAWIASIIGTIVDTTIAGWMNDKVAMFIVQRGKGVKETEARLWAALVTVVLLPAGCVLLEVGAAHGIYWIGVCFGLGIVSDNCHIFYLALSYVINCYKEISGDALTKVIVIRNVKGPLKAPCVAAALHAMCGIVANEVRDDRDGEKPGRSVIINTDHAAFWLGTVGLVKLNGMNTSEISNTGKVHEVFGHDFEQGAFATPLRLRATANYLTKTPGVWYQLHGSLNPDPALKAIGLDPKTQCATPEEAYDLISKHVQKFTADELEMMNIRLGLCGNNSYTPQGWRETQMDKHLPRHPLVNYKLQSHAISTPPAQVPRHLSDKRPLAGIKVAELVRIIAGPVIGTTLAAFGADVICVNCNRLPDKNVRTLLGSL
ncbi:hypothetical protein ANI_1_72184 [Paecilomyces variotii No. 5]|uniref:Uncharacterized protein n=1 Tax=Byssochlamys spectabilis (strain No. 5 / NBRC 109023) TaxID=1356009 RepID=V5HXS0_BYSSN|nr:hypothetical protein ANI_1_72184 [Paecilomyces variotii No. 5]